MQIKTSQRRKMKLMKKILLSRKEKLFVGQRKKNFAMTCYLLANKSLKLAATVIVFLGLLLTKHMAMKISID